MVTFFIALALLIGGYLIYSRVSEKVFAIDDRKTPAIANPQSMMPELSEETAERLASAYDFSGGQIENITRKCDIECILYGDDFVTDEKIEQYCREETIVKKGGTRIGFI